MAEKKMKIGEILGAAGAIRREQLNDALHSQNQLGGTLGENLIRLGFITEGELLKFLSEQMGLQHINLAKVEIPASVQRLVNAETVRLRRLLPRACERKPLVIGMVDPTDIAALSDVEFQTGHRNKAVILSATQFEQALAFFQTHGYGSTTLKLEKDAAGDKRPPEGNLAGMLSLLLAWNGQDLHLSAGAIPSIRVDNEIRRLNLQAL